MTITWQLVDDIAKDLSVGSEARRKWRQRGLPPRWQITIAQELMKRGVPVSLADFDKLETTPGRIAA